MPLEVIGFISDINKRLRVYLCFIFPKYKKDNIYLHFYLYRLNEYVLCVHFQNLKTLKNQNFKIKL